MKNKSFNLTMLLMALAFMFWSVSTPVLAFANGENNLNDAVKTEASVTFAGTTYNPITNTSKWNYQVVGGDQPALSHWMLGLCTKQEIVAVSDKMIDTVLSKDESTGFTGIKFDTSLEGSLSRNYWIEVKGNWNTGMIDAVIKAGNGFKTIQIAGPACTEAIANTTSTNADNSNTSLVACIPLSQAGAELKAALSTNVVDKVHKDKGTATFTVPEGFCGVQLSFSSYTYPKGIVPDVDQNNGFPYESQIFVDNITGTYGPGTHTVDINLPVCGFYQLDLYTGPVGQMLGSEEHPADKIIDWKVGGDDNCGNVHGDTIIDSKDSSNDTHITDAIIDKNLILTSDCSYNPNQMSSWLVHNPNGKAVTFTWKSTDTNQTDTATVPANGDVSFNSQMSSANTIQIFVNGKIQDTKIGRGDQCTPATVTQGKGTPTPPNSPAPAPTVTPTTVTVTPASPAISTTVEAAIVSAGTEGKLIAETPDIEVWYIPNGNMTIHAKLPNDVQGTGTWNFDLGGKKYNSHGNENISFTIPVAPVGTYKIVAEFVPNTAGENINLNPVTVSVPTFAGGKLPNTATPWYNFLLVGAMLALIGVTSWRRKRVL
jgi:LPXTG-motif cell wall-anchored protein